MNKEIKKFLSFNDQDLYFTLINGSWFIAIKPICLALNIQFVRQYKNMKSDPILVQLLSIQTIVAKDGKLRQMVCLPEKYIYGWLFSIKSDSIDLKNYKLECYNILYDHFHGTITKRSELIGQYYENQKKISKLTSELNNLSKDFVEILNLKSSNKRIKLQLAELDKKLIKIPQLELFTDKKSDHE